MTWETALLTLEPSELLPPAPELCGAPPEEPCEDDEGDGTETAGVVTDGVDPAGVETEGTVTDGTVTEGTVSVGAGNEGVVTGPRACARWRA